MKPFLWLGLIVLCAPAWAQHPATIHVVDPQNAPVADATVEVTLRLDGQTIFKAGKTGANGEATLDLPIAPREEAPLGVMVVAPGYAFSRVALVGPRAELKLEKGVVWRGQVVDEDQRPVVGAIVSVRGGILTDGRDRIILGSGPFAKAITVNTGAEGRFEIADVPHKGVIYRVTAPGYVSVDGTLGVPEEPTTLKLTRGVVVTGRALGLDGKPLADLMVRARSSDNGDGYGDARTAADGTFRIDTLIPDSYTVTFDMPEGAEYLLPAIENVRVERGENIPRVESRAAMGVLVTGIVRDTKDGTPIAEARVGAFGPHQPLGKATQSAPTGADGVFTIRLLPGKNRLYVTRRPQGYLSSDTQKEIAVGPEPPADLVLELTKVMPLRGLMVDEAGKPVAATVQLETYSPNGDFIRSDKEGKWQLNPSLVGQFQNGFPLRGGDDEDGYTEVISPQTLDLNNPEEVTIKVRKKGWLVLPGRALTLEGKPLDGVQVKVSYYPRFGPQPGPIYTSQRAATSDAHGNFTVPQIRAVADTEQMTVNGLKSGYILRSGGEVSKNGPIWQVSDLIFAPLNRTVVGTTLPGAKVVVDEQETVADGEGKFRLEGLAQGSSSVFAAKDDLFGVAVKEPFHVDLKRLMAQPSDPVLAREVWNGAPADGRGADTFSPMVLEAQLTPPEGRAALLEKMKGDDPSLMALCFAWSGQGDPAMVLKACGLIKNPDYRVAAYQMSALKMRNPDLGRMAIKEAEAKFALPGEKGFMDEMNMYSAATVITRFEGEQAGFKALDRAIAYTLKNHGVGRNDRRRGEEMGQDDVFALQARVVAAGSPALLERLMDNIAAEPEAGFHAQAYSTAIPVLAKEFGFEVALPFLEKLHNLPETKPEETGEGRRLHNPTKSLAFAEAASYVVLRMEKSPEEALKLARRVDGDPYRARALAAAARFQNGEVASQTWKAAIEGADAMEAPLFASWAWESDSALGEQLFTQARRKIEDNTERYRYYRDMWANFAFYYARAHPAQARLLIEREWSKAKNERNGQDRLSSLALAMSAVDGRRALELARQLPTDKEGGRASAEVFTQIGQYLAMAPEKRRVWGFNNWHDTTVLQGDVE